MGCQCSSDLLASSARCPPSLKIRDQFKIGKHLGSGTFGRVHECCRRSDGELFAVKIIARQQHAMSQWSHESVFQREVELLTQLDSPYVIRCLGFFEDADNLYVVIERCAGGDLFEHIIKARRLPEYIAADFSRQMLKALAYIHSANIVHRDVKAENFLFKNKSSSYPLKLIDFGMSVTVSPDEQQPLSEICGSPHYLSPELIQLVLLLKDQAFLLIKRYDAKADLWALGVLVYLMLYGKYPFHGPNTEAIVRDILRYNVQFDCPNVHLSPEALDFVKRLLEPDTSKRFSAEEALVHTWINQLQQSSSSVKDDSAL